MNMFSKNAIALFFSFLITSNSPAHASNNIFEKYIGCYATVKVNGAPVVEAPFIVESEFRKSNESGIQDPDTREVLPTIAMAIFQGYSPADDSLSIQFQSILTNKGRIFNDINGDHFEFYGKLYFELYNDILTVEMTTDILPLDNSQIEVRLFYKIVGFDAGQRFSYILKKKTCS